MCNIGMLGWHRSLDTKEGNQIQDMAMFTGYKRKEIKSGIQDWHQHGTTAIASVATFFLYYKRKEIKSGLTSALHLYICSC